MPFLCANPARIVPCPARLLLQSEYNPLERYSRLSTVLSPTPFRGLATRPLQYCTRLLRQDETKATLQTIPVPKKEKRFTYRVAASYSGKQYKFDSKRHYYSFDSTITELYLGGNIRDLEAVKVKRIPSGQDGCFISPVGTTGSAAFGVADGVGGWIDQGIDSADFAHGICRHMSNLCRSFRRDKNATWSEASAMELLDKAYDEVCDDNTISGGGSTACVGIASKDGTLNVANLGDSGFMHVRLNKVHYVSPHQTHAFNTPYQLSRIPRKLKEQILAFGGQGPISDTPKHADQSTHILEHGDVLLFATDGVWDNLSAQDLLGIVSERLMYYGAWADDGQRGMIVSERLPRVSQEPVHGYSKSLQASVATDVVAKAKEASRDEKRDSPFARAVRSHYPHERYYGGKVDDICVVVGIVVNESII